MTDALADYLLRVTVRESDVLRRLREETGKMPAAGMQISPEQGQFMRWLNELLGTRRALEVGVFTGYSSICVASALPEQGCLIACDVSEEWTTIARRYWREAGVERKIELRLAPALQTLDALLAGGEAGSFDFAFVDADKEGYGAYYERCFELVRPGGVIAFDNMLWNGRVADASATDPATAAIRRVNERASADSRVSASLLPIGDGLLLARKL